MKVQYLTSPTAALGRCCRRYLPREMPTRAYYEEAAQLYALSTLGHHKYTFIRRLDPVQYICGFRAVKGNVCA